MAEYGGVWRDGLFLHHAEGNISDYRGLRRSTSRRICRDKRVGWVAHSILGFYMKLACRGCLSSQIYRAKQVSVPQAKK